METIVVIWLCFAAVGAMIGSKKGGAGEGFALGLIFGPFGVAFAYMMKGNRRTCPACRSLIHREATICPHCRERVETVGPKNIESHPEIKPNPVIDRIGLAATIAMGVALIIGAVKTLFGF